MMEDIILLGLGGHAHSVVDSIEKMNQYNIVGFFDSAEKQDASYKKYRVIGTDDDLQYAYEKGVRNAFICIGYLGKGTVRNKLYNKLINIGFNIPNIIDTSAEIASDVIIGSGNFIGKKAIVNSYSQIGDMTIINSGAIVEHDCVIQDYSHISVGATICGDVIIGRECFIGANATVINGLQIGNETIIGAGTIVTHNVLDRHIKYADAERSRDEK